MVDSKGHVHKQVTPTGSWGSAPIREPVKATRQDYATHGEGRRTLTHQLSADLGGGLPGGNRKALIPPGTLGLRGMWADWLLQSGKVLSKGDVFWE